MSEGQTSTPETTLDLEEIRRLAEEHRRNRPTPGNPAVAAEVARLDAIIAAMPDDHEQAEFPAEVAAPPAAPRTWHPIHVGRGWPARYVGEMAEPQGGEWKAAFALLAPVIESGGIGLLHGKRGAGKTRMAAEIARSGRFPDDQTARQKLLPGAVRAEKSRTAVYRTAMAFFLDVRATYGNSEKSERDVIDSLTEPGLLVLDELQERGDTAFENRLLTHLIDARYGAMLPTILIANLTKPELETNLGPSIADRVAENGRRIEFTWDSYRRRKA